MSTERASTPVPIAGAKTAALLALAALAVSARFAHAAEVDFRPSLAVGWIHDGNVAVVGTNERGDDTITTVADIAVDRKTPTSTLSFAYRPQYVAYADNSDLNYFGQAARLGFTKSSSRDTKFLVDVAGSRTERQGVNAFRPEQPVAFVPRSTETRADGRVGGTVNASRRSLFDWQVSAGTNQFSDSTLEDDIFYGGAGAWRYQLSERSSLGIGARFEQFTYDTLSNVTTETLGLVGSHQVSQQTTLTYSAGATRSTSEGSDDVNFSGEFVVAHAVGELTTLTAGIRQSAGPGIGSGGATTDRGAYAAYRRRAERRGFEANVLAGVWERERIEIAGAAAGSTLAWNTAVTLGWAFNRFVSLNLFGAYTDQGTSDAVSSSLETSYANYGLYVHWAILGR